MWRLWYLTTHEMRQTRHFRKGNKHRPITIWLLDWFRIINLSCFQACQTDLQVRLQVSLLWVFMIIFTFTTILEDSSLIPIVHIGQQCKTLEHTGVTPYTLTACMPAKRPIPLHSEWYRPNYGHSSEQRRLAGEIAVSNYSTSVLPLSPVTYQHVYSTLR